MDPAAASLPYMEGPFGHLSEETFYLTTFPLRIIYSSWHPLWQHDPIGGFQWNKENSCHSSEVNSACTNRTFRFSGFEVGKLGCTLTSVGAFSIRY